MAGNQKWCGPVLSCHAMKLFFQPFLGGGEFTNAISGRIMLGKETLVTIHGHWDEEIFIKDKRTGVIDFLFRPPNNSSYSPETRFYSRTSIHSPVQKQHIFF